MSKITLAKAFRLLRTNKNFGKHQALEISANRITGQFFGIVDESYLQVLSQRKENIFAYTSVKDNGLGIGGGKTRSIRVVDMAGCGFEEAFSV